ncbi:MAG: glycosyltransferase [Candidatus Binatia bacterium]
MNIFAGKKALCFIALPYHNRILLPIMEELTRRGMEVKFFTAAAEAAFEITLNDAGLPYQHVLDYATDDIAAQVSEAWQTLRPIWQDKLLTNPLLHSVPLVIQDKVIRSVVENAYCFKQMLEVEKPDLLFALHELNSWGKILGHLSHVCAIPYLTFQEGLCYARGPLYRFHTDYTTACVVWGEADRQVLLAAGCSPEKTVALGNIDLWATKEKVTQPDAMAATRQALGIGPDKKVVVFFMSYASYNPFAPSIFLEWLRAHPEVVVVFKWHPIQSKDVVERTLEKFKGVASVFSVVGGADTYSLLALSDACVLVGNSTTGIEALFFNKPLIEISLVDHLYSYAAQGVAESANGFEDIGEKLERLLTQGLSPEQQQRISAFLDRHFAFLDGKTAERVVEMAKEMLEARATEPKSIINLSSGSEKTIPCSLILPVNDSSYDAVIGTLRSLGEHVPAHLFELLIVNAVSHPEARALIASVGGEHVRVITGDPEWNFATCCNQAAAEAQGRYLTFLKPGIVPAPGWLEGLLEVAAQEQEADVIGGLILNEQGLVWHAGTAFDINQSPFSLYRMLPMAFHGVQKQREFQAVEGPFLVGWEQFCRLGGFSEDLANRFEEVDFCLRLRKAGGRVLYTPRSISVRTADNWQPTPEQDRVSCFRFYARWTGSLWQNDEHYLKADGFDHDSLSALYREFAQRLSREVTQKETEAPRLVSSLNL